VRHHARHASHRIPAGTAVSDVASAKSGDALQTHAGDADASGADDVVRAQLFRLQQTVAQQQRVLDLQQAAIRDLQSAIQQQQAPAARAPGLTPFEAQAFAAMDRRTQGLYDARFHSTSR
jgi:hypothetical protein